MDYASIAELTRSVHAPDSWSVLLKHTWLNDSWLNYTERLLQQSDWIKMVATQLKEQKLKDKTKAAI